MTFTSGTRNSPPDLTRTTDTFRFCFKSSAGQLSFDFLLSLTDRYDCRNQFKGGSCQFVATKIYSTSPLHPRDWYPELDARDSFSQLERRLTHVIDLNGIAEEERAKRVCLMLESGEGFVDVEEDQKATKIVDLPLVQSPPWRSAYNSTSELASPGASSAAAVSPLIAPHIPDGFELRVVPGDGNCLFHALCAGMDDGLSASVLRQMVVAYVSAHPTQILQGARFDHMPISSFPRDRESHTPYSRVEWVSMPVCWRRISQG